MIFIVNRAGDIIYCELDGILDGISINCNEWTVYTETALIRRSDAVAILNDYRSYCLKTGDTKTAAALKKMIDAANSGRKES